MKTKNDILVIADDFTGAYDMGVQMQKMGVSVNVVFDDFIAMSGYSYIADTKSRNLSADKAYYATKDIISKTISCHFGIYYLKIDSTLRGNICPGIKAFTDSFYFDFIVVDPAYPKLKRTVINEITYINDVPVVDTDIASEPGNNGGIYNLKDTIAFGLNEEVQYYYISNIRSEEFHINEKGSNILCFDTMTDQDMDIIVKSILKTNKKILWVGSIGLAEAILRVLYPVNSVLCVIGSVTDVTHKQIAYAVSKGVGLIRIDIISIINGSSMDSYVEEATNMIEEGKDVIVCTSINSRDIIRGNCVEIYPKQQEQMEKMLSLINTILNKIAIKILEVSKVSGVYLSGGDTAGYFVKDNCNFCPQIIGEILPSIPLLLLKINNKNIKVILKSGRVGDEKTMFFCIDKLKEKWEISNEGIS